MTVCFCGHGKLYSSYDSIRSKCLEIVRGLTEKGADSFLIGDYGILMVWRLRYALH